MKKILSFAAVSLLLYLSACTPDDTSPSTDSRNDFTGTWNCVETLDNNPAQVDRFTMTITTKGTKDTILLNRINNLGNYAAYAIVSASALTIPSQNVDNNEISGTGIKSKQKINLHYTVADGQTTESFSAELTK